MRRWRPILLVLLLLGTLAVTVYLGWLEQQFPPPAPPENYSLIEPGLYMGNAVDVPPPDTTAVLNLCQTADRYQCEVHKWEPIRDAAPAPSLDWLRKQVDFVTAQRKAGRTTYVHCRAGISRSGMVVTAYLMQAHGWTRDEALAFVRTKRPLARPNPAFMELLLQWQAELKP